MFAFNYSPDERNRRSINILNISISFRTGRFVDLLRQSLVREENTADHTKDMQIDSNFIFQERAKPECLDNNIFHKVKHWIDRISPDIETKRVYILQE